ncbi:sulfur carrier protein ThiS [Massilia sp. Dwa41.01b]|uniref:sulfur carrier protein ThiS n=1 Tax=unclassified Massilia TaxID=2609279 RepID=UPI001603FFD7|nr:MULTISPECIES: sulfur carrier protein ThiS [unclassified Massilia]QNA87895.1 sulfur carrier protein ThiS [Massilia sp. Dwa41.01b]QNA98799.1 sulfur carrier protein ThiS [Massilia sp. Se16.2.3]
MFDIELNGEPYSLLDGQTLGDLVQALGVGKQAVALAVNREVVPRQQWASRVLARQDKVDIVRAIGGG